MSRVILKRSIKQYKSVIVEHDPGVDERTIRRRALADNRSGEGFVRKEKERVRIDVVRIEPVKPEDI